MSVTSDKCNNYLNNIVKTVNVSLVPWQVPNFDVL